MLTSEDPFYRHVESKFKAASVQTSKKDANKQNENEAGNDLRNKEKWGRYKEARPRDHRESHFVNVGPAHFFRELSIIP